MRLREIGRLIKISKFTIKQLIYYYKFQKTKNSPTRVAIAKNFVRSLATLQLTCDRFILGSRCSERETAADETGKHCRSETGVTLSKYHNSKGCDIVNTLV